MLTLDLSLIFRGDDGIVPWWWESHGGGHEAQLGYPGPRRSCLSRPASASPSVVFVRHSSWRYLPLAVRHHHPTPMLIDPVNCSC